MTTAKDGMELTRVGPGTVMGGLMRSYWLPALKSSELVADGPPDEGNSLPDAQAGSVVAGTITRGETVFSVIDAEATWRNIRDSIEGWYKDDQVHEPLQTC